MITESYHRNTKLNPAPNFQWTHCHFIGNNLPSQIYCVLLSVYVFQDKKLVADLLLLILSL